ncbi:hypothetical protein CDAR_181731 [Caerostris darwini]|uniref:Uncharacterized protein n=1 Tax=Caerostris darwini TaxID=1538125 RepID=A0AAV4US36_9ARAC|nr:hypothetical protein CDAR_181731 [Caerostris darwini]
MRLFARKTKTGHMWPWVIPAVGDHQKCLTVINISSSGLSKGYGRGGVIDLLGVVDLKVRRQYARTDTHSNDSVLPTGVSAFSNSPGLLNHGIVSMRSLSQASTSDRP